MNYYKRHLGDYAKDAGWLSTYQHGVYTLLMDWYYANERPIPLDIVHRLVRARSGPERVAVDEVVSAFFDVTKDPGFAHNKRADIEIAKRVTKSEANSLIAKEAWDAKRMRNAGNPHQNEMPAISHKPLANNQEQKKHVPQAARFEEFWAGYPVKKEKKGARAKWIAKRLDERADEIIADVKARISKDDQWRRGFIPHPTTYLNGERWNDEMTAPRQQPTLPFGRTEPPIGGTARAIFRPEQKMSEDERKKVLDKHLVAAAKLAGVHINTED